MPRLSEYHTFTEDELIAAALEVANAFREFLNLEPLDSLVGGCGRTFNACGIAHAVNHGLVGEPYYVMNGSTHEVGVRRNRCVTLHQGVYGQHESDVLMTVPNDAAWWFVQEFDRGGFPHLRAEQA